MPNHDWTRPFGVWNPLEAVLSAELADIDNKSTHSIDDRGGTYSLTEPMTIGGAPGVEWQFDLDVNFSADAHMSGSLEVFGNTGLYGGNTTIGTGPGDFLAVQCPAEFIGFTTFDAFATFNEQAAFNEGFVVASGKFCNFDGAFFDGEVTFGDAVFFQDTVDFAVGATFSDQATFYEQVVFQKAIVLTGEARIQQRQAIGGDENATYDAKSYTHVRVPAGTLTQIRYYTIGDTGAQNGDRIRFSSADNGFDVGIKSPGGTQITTVKAGGVQSWVDIERVQGEWIMMGGV